MDPTTTPGAPTYDARKARKAAVAAALATSLEWYDFFIFGTAAALVFNETFFKSDDPTLSSILSFGTFAVAFIARPIGGVVAGNLGDRIGRKPVLLAAIVLMAVATFLIGFTPNIEGFAAVWLVVMRLLQGLALGGQWGGAMLLATESAPPHRKGFFGSFAQLGVPIGLLAGNLIFLGLNNNLAEDDFLSWGWRIAFWLSILMLGVGLWIHKQIEETVEAAKAADEESPTEPAEAPKAPALEVIKTNWSTIVLAAGAFLVVTALFYATVLASIDHATKILDLSKQQILEPTLAGSAVMVLVMPFAALASDIYGRARIYTIGLVGIAIWAFPMWIVFDQATPDNTLPVWIAICVAMVPISICYGPQAALFGEIFPAHLRYSGASMGYTLASVIAGLTPSIMVALVDGDKANSWRFGAYIFALSLLALVSIQVLARAQQRRLAAETTGTHAKSDLVH